MAEVTFSERADQIIEKAKVNPFFNSIDFESSKRVVLIRIGFISINLQGEKETGRLADELISNICSHLANEKADKSFFSKVDSLLN
jgi:hypothetical protein